MKTGQGLYANFKTAMQQSLSIPSASPWTHRINNSHLEYSKNGFGFTGKTYDLLSYFI